MKGKNAKLSEGVLEASCFSWLVLFGISQFSVAGHVPSRMMTVPPLPLCTGVMKAASLPPAPPWLPVSTPESRGPRCWGSPPKPHAQTVPSIPRNAVSTANTQRLSGGAALGCPRVTAAPLIGLVAFSLQLPATFHCL